MNHHKSLHHYKQVSNCCQQGFARNFRVPYDQPGIEGPTHHSLTFPPLSIFRRWDRNISTNIYQPSFRTVQHHKEIMAQYMKSVEILSVRRPHMDGTQGQWSKSSCGPRTPLVKQPSLAPHTTTFIHDDSGSCSKSLTTWHYRSPNVFMSGRCIETWNIWQAFKKDVSCLNNTTLSKLQASKVWSDNNQWSSGQTELCLFIYI